ncbi:MAG: oligosaccharide flippase family protein [Massilia sp.]|nr:oligosaccharide flippase family protein [Massilia sp.]
MADLRRSLVINFFSSSGAALVQFMVSITLARMLTPSEIGVFSMTVVFVNIAHIFRDFGVATYLQREPDLTREKMRSAIGVLLASSWLIALLLVLVSQLIGDWFREPGIVPVMRVLAVGFLIIPFGSVTNAMLAREFAADKQAVITAAGTVSFCATCIGCAALGFGSMSLAYANLCNIVVCALASIPFRPKGTPFLPSFRHWGAVVNFGAGTLITNCATAINNALPDILLGKLGTAHHVGLFSRANSTVSIFSHVAGTTVTYGAVSYLSRAHQSGESLVPILKRATALLTGVGWPAFALTAILGRDIVMTLYGDAWLDCVPAITPLAIAIGLTMVFQYTPIALTAIGRPYLGAFPVVVTLFTRIGFAFLLFDGSLRTFSWTICFATVAAVPIMLMQQRKYFGVGLGALLRTLKPSALTTLNCVIACEALKLLIPETLAPMARLALIAVPLVVVWYLALRLTGHELSSEVDHVIGGMKTRLIRLAGQR